MDVIKLRILRLRDYPVLLVWAQYNYKGPLKREAVGLEAEERFDCRNRDSSGMFGR